MVNNYTIDILKKSHSKFHDFFADYIQNEDVEVKDYCLQEDRGNITQHEEKS
jgi:hypothetical protein